ncbi:MAG: rubrerythrin family protein [Nitrospiraceae bacterium]|nr:rubrerythrin family protein [Nitrospiraceae bacterium]
MIEEKTGTGTEELTKTEKDLREAFAGESQAFMRYTSFARKADAEGFRQAAKLFRAAAAAEAIHAANHLKALNAVKSTRENLMEAIGGETYEFTRMYPAMIADAQAEDNKAALRSFNYANDTEKGHAELYKKALDQLGAGSETDYYVCDVCGYTAESELDECPVCKAKKKAFKKID